MLNTPFNKYRAAVEVLQRGRDTLIETLADEILEQADDLLDSGFMFNEFLETQGTRVHFLTLLLSQLELSAEHYDDRIADPAPPPRVEPAASVPSKKKKTRARKLVQKAPPEGSAEEA
jgi:hypothetical protein